MVVSMGPRRKGETSHLTRPFLEGCDEMKRMRETASGGCDGDYKGGARGVHATLTQTMWTCWFDNGTRTWAGIPRPKRCCRCSPPRCLPRYEAEKAVRLIRRATLLERGAGIRTFGAPLQAGQPLRQSRLWWIGLSCRAWRRD